MTMTASEMAQKSVEARKKKYGGEKGFAAHMKKLSHSRKSYKTRQQTLAKVNSAENPES
jgi:hypothetical protein